MARHLLLHVGLPKTGTTSIQRVLSMRRRALWELGLCVPVSSGGAVASFLHRTALRAGPGNRAQHFMTALAAEITALPEPVTRVILSAEQCSLFLRQISQIARLHAVLAPLFATMQVIIYLRRQDLHAASLYGQALRRGRIQPPDLDSIEQELSGLYDYDTLLAQWAEIFGAASVTPRIFEKQDLLNGDAVADFMAVCGASAALDSRIKRSSNTSIAVEGQTLLLDFGRFLQAETGQSETEMAIWQSLAAVVGELFPGTGWRPDAATASRFVARYADSNAAACRRWFPERPYLFNRDFSFLPAEPLDLQTGSSISAAGAVMTALLQKTAAPVSA